MNSRRSKQALQSATCPLCGASVSALPGEDAEAKLEAHISSGCPRTPGTGGTPRTPMGSAMGLNGYSSLLMSPPRRSPRFRTGDTPLPTPVPPSISSSSRSGTERPPLVRGGSADSFASDVDPKLLSGLPEFADVDRRSQHASSILLSLANTYTPPAGSQTPVVTPGRMTRRVAAAAAATKPGGADAMAVSTPLTEMRNEMLATNSNSTSASASSFSAATTFMVATSSAITASSSSSSSAANNHRTLRSGAEQQSEPSTRGKKRSRIPVQLQPIQVSASSSSAAHPQVVTLVHRSDTSLMTQAPPPPPSIALPVLSSTKKRSRKSQKEHHSDTSSVHQHSAPAAPAYVHGAFASKNIDEFASFHVPEAKQKELLAQFETLGADYTAARAQFSSSRAANPDRRSFIRSFVAHFYSVGVLAENANKTKQAQSVESTLNQARLLQLEPTVTSVNNIADQLLMNDLEIAVWSLYLDRLDPFWMRTDGPSQIFYLLTSAYTMKMVMSTRHLIFLPWLNQVAVDFGEKYQMWLKTKGIISLAIPPQTLNDRFSLLHQPVVVAG